MSIDLDEEEKFEYVQDMEADGDTPYYCDCCDPARQKKRHCSESDSAGVNISTNFLVIQVLPWVIAAFLFTVLFN